MDAKDEKAIPDLSAAEMQRALATGALNAVAVLYAHGARIARHNRAGAGINAVLELNPDAEAWAEALDRRPPAGPLHGIPVLLKDNIDTGDKMHTSAGSLALADSTAAEDAPLVARLRAAGALILGKANMTEWANFMAEGMPNGYSSRGGLVRNPYGAAFDPGGSSTGSAAAVAAGFAPLAVGTETSGSILSPASQQGVVGLKPTRGLVSRRGIIPIAHSQDTAGPIGRTVEDVAILLDVLAGEDPGDPATLGVDRLRPRSYRASLDPRALEGARIGLNLPVLDNVPSAARAVFLRALDALRHLGAEVVDAVVLPTEDELPGWAVLYHEFKADLNHYLGRLRDPAVPVRSLRDVIAFNAAHARRCLRYGQARLLRAEATSGTLTEPEYWEARRRDREIARGALDTALARHRLKALVFFGAAGAALGAKAGYPSITVPAGFTAAGEPVGLTFLGPAFGEPTLLGLAYAYEQATRRRRPPDLDRGSAGRDNG
jgi:amidase